MKPLNKSEILTILKQAEIELILGKEPEAEMTIEEAKEKGYISVRIPFPGYYESVFTDAVDREAAYIQERQEEWEQIDITADGWTKSPGWRKFLSALTTEEEKKEYLTGKKHLFLSIPVDQNSFIHAGISAIDEMIDNTLMKDKVRPLTHWKFDEISISSDHFYSNDQVNVWIPKEEMEEMMIPEMFKSKWYKKFAKYRTTARSGYVPWPWHTYDRYFNREDSICHEATILFWTAMGAYSRYYMIAPLSMQEADKITVKAFVDPISEEEGISISAIERYLEAYLEDDGFFPLNYRPSEAL